MDGISGGNFNKVVHLWNVIFRSVYCQQQVYSELRQTKSDKSMQHWMASADAYHDDLCHIIHSGFRRYVG